MGMHPLEDVCGSLKLGLRRKRYAKSPLEDVCDPLTDYAGKDFAYLFVRQRIKNSSFPMIS
jgi:hypothetical protein